MAIPNIFLPLSQNVLHEKREIKLTSSLFQHQTMQLGENKIPKANKMLVKRAIMETTSRNRTVFTKAAKCDGLNFIVICEGVKTGERINVIAFRRNDGCRFIIALRHPVYSSKQVISLN